MSMLVATLATLSLVSLGAGVLASGQRWSVLPGAGARNRPSRQGPLLAAIERAGLTERLASATGVEPRSVALAGASGAAGVGSGALLGGVPGAVVVGAAAALGPLLRARRRARVRRAALDAEVPQLLDLLAAASSAGLAAPLALARCSTALDGPLRAELDELAGRVALGARWRGELEGLAERSGSADLRRTVTTLARTESLGVSLATAVAELAEDVRSARAARITERARKAPVKMLFPLVFLILPAFLLLTVVPVLLSTVRSIG